MSKRDPAKFIETIHTISGEPKADDTLKTELTELRKAIEHMKEDRKEHWWVVVLKP